MSSLNIALVSIISMVARTEDTRSIRSGVPKCSNRRRRQPYKVLRSSLEGEGLGTLEASATAGLNPFGGGGLNYSIA